VDGVLEAKRITNFEGKRRQMQFIGKLMRKLEPAKLDEIRAMLTPGGQPDIDRTLLAAKADELDRTAKRLLAMSEGLRHAAVCPAPSHAECPSFQRLLKAAAAGMMAAPPQALGRRKTR